MSLNLLGCGIPQVSCTPSEWIDSGIAANLRTLQENLSEEAKFWKKSVGLKFFLDDL